MTQNDDALVLEMFANRVIDWSPSPSRHGVTLLYMPFSFQSETVERCAGVLSDTELARAERFVGGELKAHFITRRAFRRYCGAKALEAKGVSTRSRVLSVINFDTTEKGRPYLVDHPDIWFGFSACDKGFLGSWSTTHAVGVDIEDPTRDVEAASLAARFFCKAETEAINEAAASMRVAKFFELWCLKEAALKSIGEGLPYGLDAFEFLLAPKLAMVRAPREYGVPGPFDAQLIGDGDLCAALVTRRLVTRSATAADQT